MTVVRGRQDHRRRRARDRRRARGRLTDLGRARRQRPRLGADGPAAAQRRRARRAPTQADPQHPLRPRPVAVGQLRDPRAAPVSGGSGESRCRLAAALVLGPEGPRLLASALPAGDLPERVRASAVRAQLRSTVSGTRPVLRPAATSSASRSSQLPDACSPARGGTPSESSSPRTCCVSGCGTHPT